MIQTYIEIFIERARAHISEHEADNNEQKYYESVGEYLNELEIHLKENNV